MQPISEKHKEFHKRGKAPILEGVLDAPQGPPWSIGNNWIICLFYQSYKYSNNKLLPWRKMKIKYFYAYLILLTKLNKFLF